MSSNSLSTGSMNQDQSTMRSGGSAGSASKGSLAGLPPLFRLVRDGKWKKLRSKTKSRSFAKLVKERDCTGLSLLGVALGSHAPLDIIKMIVSADESQLYAVDIFGASSLHLACLNGSPLEAVVFILNHNHSLVSSRDHDRRAPLHHAVECICRGEIELSEGKEIISLLCKVDTAMIHEQDRHRNSPLDLVHCAMNDNSIKGTNVKQRLESILSFLRRISIDVYKLKKKLWEEKIPFEKKKIILGTVGTQSTSSLTNPSIGRSIAPSAGDASLSTTNQDYQMKE